MASPGTYVMCLTCAGHRRDPTFVCGAGIRLCAHDAGSARDCLVRRAEERVGTLLTQLDRPHRRAPELCECAAPRCCSVWRCVPIATFVLFHDGPITPTMELRSTSCARSRDRLRRTPASRSTSAGRWRAKQESNHRSRPSTCAPAGRRSSPSCCSGRAP